MQTTLYADVLMLVNFSMDFISLWAAALIGARERRALRMSLAAALGGVYGVISVILTVGGIWVYILCAVVSVFMSLIAFGKCGGVFGLLKQSALVWGCGALLGGLMTALLSIGGTSHTYAGNPANGGFLPLFAAGGAAVYIIARLIGARRGMSTASVTVTYAGKTVSFSALCDSGNLLCDPVSGVPCVLLSSSVVSRLAGERLTDALLHCDVEALTEARVRFRIIPRKSADKTSLSAALVPESAELRGRRHTERVRLVIMPTECAENYFGGFPATLPASLSTK